MLPHSSGVTCYNLVSASLGTFGSYYDKCYCRIAKESPHRNVAERTWAVIRLLKIYVINILEKFEINFVSKAKLLIARVSRGAGQKLNVEQNSISKSNYKVFFPSHYNTGAVVFLQHEISMIDVFLTS